MGLDLFFFCCFCGSCIGLFGLIFASGGEIRGRACEKNTTKKKIPPLAKRLLGGFGARRGTAKQGSRRRQHPPKSPPPQHRPATSGRGLLSGWKVAISSALHQPPRWVAGIFQSTKKLFLSERAGRGQTLEFIRKNAANGLSVANLVAGLSSVLCSLNRWGKKGKWGEMGGCKGGVTPVLPYPSFPRQHHHSCWLLLVGFLLDLADGAVARQLDACSALGESLPPPRGPATPASPLPPPCSGSCPLAARRCQIG